MPCGFFLGAAYAAAMSATFTVGFLFVVTPTIEVPVISLGVSLLRNRWHLSLLCDQGMSLSR